MTLPEHVRAVLDDDAQRTWEAIRDLLPPAAYLVGGTAITIRLGHRVSRDLDFFLERPVDLDRLEGALRDVGPLVVRAREAGTLDCVLGRTRVQFLDASDQRLVEPTETVAGVRLAGLGDLLATKLKVVVDRPELRDSFDLMAIEQQAHRYVEEGLALFLERYAPAAPDQTLRAVVNALAYLGDVEEDPALPASPEEVEGYWSRRVPEVVAHFDRSGWAQGR